VFNRKEPIPLSQAKARRTSAILLLHFEYTNTAAYGGYCHES